MKKLTIAFLFVFFVITQTIFAQDIIVFQSGDELKARVEQVGTEKITYKRFDNLNGPSYEVFKWDVFMIKYENGTKDVFNDNELPPPPPTPIFYPSKKEPMLSLMLSFLIPGGGQYYNGEYLKGGIMTGIWAASIIGMVACAQDNYDYYYDDYYYYHDHSSNGAEVFAVILLGNYIWSMIDAPVSSSKINKRNMLSWNVGKNSTLSLKPDFQVATTMPIGQSFYSPSFGAKLSLTIK